jgi:hypothetical protein
MADNVNHPAHYEASTSIECIEAMELMFGEQAVYDFCLCNAYKYIWRHKLKGKPEEDLAKADWYIKRAYSLDYGDYHDRIIGLRDLHTMYVNKLANQETGVNNET